MTILGKTLIGLGVATGVTWLVMELSKKHPKPAKSIVDLVNEAGNFMADNISNHPSDKLAIEIVKKDKDFLAERAKDQLDEYHNQSRKGY